MPRGILVPLYRAVSLRNVILMVNTNRCNATLSATSAGVLGARDRRYQKLEAVAGGSVL